MQSARRSTYFSEDFWGTELIKLSVNYSKRGSCLFFISGFKVGRMESISFLIIFWINALYFIVCKKISWKHFYGSKDIALMISGCSADIWCSVCHFLSRAQWLIAHCSSFESVLGYTEYDIAKWVILLGEHFCLNSVLSISGRVCFCTCRRGKITCHFIVDFYLECKLLECSFQHVERCCKWDLANA